MSNLRDVKNDLLKDWLLFREDEIAALYCDEDKKHWVYFDEISERILKNVPEQNKKYVRKHPDRLMRILWIILVIGMRNIIGMCFVMECN